MTPIPVVDPYPVAEPMFTHLLVMSMRDDRLEAGPKPKAFETPFRHSDAGKCARHLGMALAKIPITNPFDYPSDWVTSVGSLLHEKWQEALLKIYPDSEIELKVSNGELTSGHIDALIRAQGRSFSYELKSINGFGFTKAIGVVKQRGGQLVTPEGPKVAHVIQASLNAKASDADYAVIGYLSLESISLQVAANLELGELDRIMAEWAFPRDVYEPIADRELARLAEIRKTVELKRNIPIAEAIGDDGTLVYLNPNNNFRPWQCYYCPYMTLCQQLSPLEETLDEAWGVSLRS